MDICIYGSGAVGTAVGRGFASLGHEVIFYDIDASKIARMSSEGFNATIDSKQAVEKSDVIIICVPTPEVAHKISLSYIRAACEEIGRQLCAKQGYTLVVMKSTVTPGTCEGVMIPLLEKHSGKKAGRDFGVCSNPEFLRENNAYDDFMNPDRIVIGELDSRSGEMLEGLYAGFSCPKIRTDFRTSEMAKYASNTFYATKISFFNEIHGICKKAGADSQLVRKIVQLDRFYATHPWSHGKSYGGACLPKDTDALIHFSSSQMHFNPKLLKAVREVNDEYRAAEASFMPIQAKPAKPTRAARPIHGAIIQRLRNLLPARGAEE